MERKKMIFMMMTRERDKSFIRCQPMDIFFFLKRTNFFMETRIFFLVEKKKKERNLESHYYSIQLSNVNKNCIVEL